MVGDSSAALTWPRVLRQGSLGHRPECRWRAGRSPPPGGLEAPRAIGHTRSDYPWRLSRVSEIRAVGDPPRVRIAAAGDIGIGDREERETAHAMASLPGRPYDALVLLGDNVYPSGDPNRLDATVFGPFNDILDQGATLVAALGNHDVQYGNGPAQVDALGLPGRRC